MLFNLFSLFGFLLLVYILIQFLKPFFTYYILRYILTKRKDLKSAGDWAIITGCTDGIGKSFANELAADGLNIFLISRSEEKLKKVASEIESNSAVKTRIFVADFTKVDFYDALKKEIDTLSSVSCLINNVGVSYELPEGLADEETITVDCITRMISCNTISMAAMSRITLPKMLQSPPKNAHRYIVNISSFSGCFYSPYLTIYAATKSFVSNFSGSLSAELVNTCVRVQTFTPGFIQTKMSGMRSSSLFVPSPKVYANSALDMVGVEDVSCGYFFHALLLYFILLVPDALRTRRIASRMLKSRERILRSKKAKNN